MQVTATFPSVSFTSCHFRTHVSVSHKYCIHHFHWFVPIVLSIHRVARILEGALLLCELVYVIAHMQEINIMVMLGTYIAYKKICHSLCIPGVDIWSRNIGNFFLHFSTFPCVCEALILYSNLFTYTNYWYHTSVV